MADLLKEVVKREDWGARSPKSMSTHSIGPSGILFVHYSAAAGKSFDTLAEQKAAVKGIQNYHMDSNGWSDIGYPYLIAQGWGNGKPRLFEGRTFKYVPAAQEGHNTGNGAVCVLMKEGEELKQPTVDLLARVFKHFPGNTVKGHKDVYPTACPGTKLYAAIPEIAKKGKPKKTPYLP